VTRGIGLDFGTTNSALALAEPGAAASVVRFAATDGDTEAFRSVLFSGRAEGARNAESVAGPLAIERYLEFEGDRRLLQSLKAFLASRLFTSTNLLGRPTTLQDMIARIVRSLREETESQHGPLEGTVVVGRPVRFARSKQTEDDEFARDRLADSLRQAGFSDIRFEYEPVAAAYHYEQSLDADEQVLIADFGGGTSDFCLLRVGPSFRGRARRDDDILATRGVALAGDAFDARIVRNVVAPVLGRGSQHRNMFGELLPVPVWIYKDLERWHHLSFLKSPRTLSLLHEIRDGAEDEAALTSLIHIVEYDLGFHLYRAVERTKRELSQAAESRFVFDDGPAKIDQRVTRADFEAWIAPEIEEIAGCVDALLTDTGTAVESVDRVFMTGGSSFVPAVRGIFADRFGEERLRAGGELISVASGLALRARSLE
jgi:hypothetical chaperone protein